MLLKGYQKHQQTLTVEMENINVPAPPPHNCDMISEENITDNHVTRQREKTKDNVGNWVKQFDN